MLKYDSRLKPVSRILRSHMTDAEQVLWSALRRKQILGVQFYRQKPIGPFIVDFYGPAAGLVIEVDGSQHYEADRREHDARRTDYLNSQGLKVLRFNNLEILKELASVVAVIFCEVEIGLANKEIPPNPPFAKGENDTPAALEARSDGQESLSGSPFAKGGNDAPAALEARNRFETAKRSRLDELI